MSEIDKCQEVLLYITGYFESRSLSVIKDSVIITECLHKFCGSCFWEHKYVQENTKSISY